ncbi:hypothetical protein LFL96_14085 [Paraburkholderia sp. D15]|uniref:hypothetical protein n=1 Tax=Paraburkholderia sp. D15 TaxID=2880218 RepID=UPI0024794CB2|nr:hypothetical protein [Paraburkholderia sp. D15]WGS48898.1 hypothetical protein LFL96_14085 [Paraburkholderia sp. D15]
MSANLPETDGQNLWTRAPLWRLSVSAAVLLSAAVVCFPPKWRVPAVQPLPPMPEAVSYTSQQKAVVAQAMPASNPAPVGKRIAATPDQAPVNAAPKQAASGRKSGVATLAAAPGPAVKPPVTAQISMATPNAAGGSDPSGLDRAFVGRTYRQSIAADGFNVPLPPGQWAVLSNSSIRMRGASGVAYFLGRIEHKRLVGAIRLFALHSSEQPGAGFPAATGCTTGNPNLNHLVLDSVTPYGHQACWLISNYFTPPLQQWADRATKISGLDRAAGGDLAAKGVDYPQDFVDIRFTRAETWGVLEVSYLFDPEIEGITASTALSARESDWHAPNAPRFPDKMAYLAKMQEWGEGLWPTFQQAFDSGKPPPVAVNP